MKERGSALLTAVIIVMVLLSISGIFLTRVIYQAKNESSEERGLRTYYLAEAGIQYGIAVGIKAISDGVLTLEEGGTLSPAQVDDPFGQGGSFKVTVTREAEATSFTVKSTGDYLGIRRIKKAEYEFGGEGGGGGGGDDDDDCEDDDVLPDYPAWIAKVYSEKTYVIYTDIEGNKRVFYNIWYAHATDVPGVGTDGPWQEVTIKWKKFNRYKKDSVNIICFDGEKFKVTTSDYSNNQQPGVAGKPWQEITNEWRDFNVYSRGDIVAYEGNLFQAWYDIYNFLKPGLKGDPWQNLTNKWQNFNKYVGGEIVTYDGKLFRARYDTNFMQPGLKDSPWQELTKEWRSFNIYQPSDNNVYIEVEYNGQRYRANYYSQDIVPGSSNAWQLIHNSTITSPVLLGVMVTPATASITVGQTQTFTAKAIYSDGSSTDVTNLASWSSSNTSIATVTRNVAKGLATGVVTGTILESTPISVPIGISIPIIADYGGKVGTAFLTINVSTNSDPNPSPTPGTNTGKLLWEKEIID